jgi:antitoxin CcdA
MGKVAATRSPVLRRPTNVTFRLNLVAEAKQPGINVSEACEAGLSERVRQAWRLRWLEENQTAIEEYNDRVERDGLTLERFRRF